MIRYIVRDQKKKKNRSFKHVFVVDSIVSVMRFSLPTFTVANTQNGNWLYETKLVTLLFIIKQTYRN